jgi:translation elongation factor EF-4
MSNNKKLFSLYLRNKTIFDPIYLSAFSFITTFIANLKTSSIRLLIIMTFLARMLSSIKVSRIRIVSVLRQTLKSITLIKIGKIGLMIAAVKMIQRIVAIQKIGKMVFSYKVSLRERISGYNAKISRIKFIFYPSYGTFIKLSTYDPQTLTALDSKTLGDMDAVFS